MKKTVNERLMSVRGAVSRDCLPMIERLTPELQPPMDFVGQDFLPLLVLLPMVKNKERSAVNLAHAMECAYLAGRVHDLNSDVAVQQGQELCGHAILVGDYLYANAAVLLNSLGYDGWLDKVGSALVRRSEARQVRLSWDKRAYVTEEERLANLPKEHAELVSLAARLAAEAADFAADEMAAYAEFGFYAGVLHGLAVLGYTSGEVADRAMQQNFAKARAALAKLPDLADTATDMLLRPLVSTKYISNKEETQKIEGWWSECRKN